MSKQSEGLTFYWSIVPFGEARVHIAATERGLAFIGALDGPFEEMERGAARRFNIAAWVRNDARLERYCKELAEYEAGARTTFEGNLDLRGTPFQLKVWKTLQDIPFGETCSYSDIAAAIGSPSAVRAVGSAIGANPILVMVPCHRVVGKDGKLTGYRGGLPMKQLLLRLEQDGLALAAGNDLVAQTASDGERKTRIAADGERKAQLATDDERKAQFATDGCATMVAGSGKGKSANDAGLSLSSIASNRTTATPWQ